MPKIAFITNSLTGGGAERSVNLLVNELSRRKLNVSLIPINSSSDDLVVPNCSIISLNRKWNSGSLRTFYHLIQFNYVMLKLKPDLIVLNVFNIHENIIQYIKNLKFSKLIIIACSLSDSKLKLLSDNFRIRKIKYFKNFTSWIRVISCYPKYTVK
jgi:hypothetical protein